MVNLVVFFGGESCEHDVSIITGLQFISKVNEYLYNIIPIYIDKNGDWLTGKNLKDLMQDILTKSQPTVTIFGKIDKDVISFEKIKDIVKK